MYGGEALEGGGLLGKHWGPRHTLQPLQHKNIMYGGEALEHFYLFHVTSVLNLALAPSWVEIEHVVEAKMFTFTLECTH